MSQAELELRSFLNVGNHKASECLFKIYPQLTNQAMLECLKYNKYKDQSKQEELLLNLNKELESNKRTIDIYKDSYVLYNDTFILQHVVSKKYLSIKQSPFDPNIFNLKLDVQIEDQVGFQFQQFYKNRIKKEDLVSFGDKVCITIINLKDQYLQRHCSIKKFWSDKEILQNTIPYIDIQFSEDTSKINPFEIVKYFSQSQQEGEKSVLKAGSIYSISHIETSGQIYEKQIIEEIEEDDQKFNNQVEEERNEEEEDVLIAQSKSNFENDINNNNQKQIKQRATLQYYLTDNAKNEKSSNLWIIEKINPFEGGCIYFKDFIRFQNIRSGKYLKFQSDQKQSPKFDFSIFMEQNSKSNMSGDDLNSVFILIDEKGIDKTQYNLLSSNFSFCIIHALTGQQIGMKFDQSNCSYRLNLCQSSLYAESFKINILSENVCWDVLFVESCKQMLEINIQKIQQILNVDSLQLSYQNLELLIGTIHTIDSLNRFVKSNDIYLDDIFLFKTDQENEARLNMMIIKNVFSTIIKLIKTILMNQKNFTRLKLFAHSQRDPNEYQQVQLKKFDDNQFSKQKMQSQVASQQIIQGSATKIEQNDILTSNQNLFISLMIIINNSYELLSLLIKSDSFPQEIIKKTILEIIFMIGVGNCWKCLSYLIRKYNYLDHVIQVNDLTLDQFKNREVFVNSNILQIITMQYLKNYDGEEKYCFDFIEFLISICRDMDEKIKIKNQILIGKLMFEELSEQQFEQLFILFKIVRRDYTVEKQIQIQIGIYKWDFLRFIRLTNNSSRGREMNLFLHTVKLLSLITQDRNYFNIYKVRQYFPYYFLLSIIRNDDINYLIRGFFLELYINLYTNVDPFYKLQNPKTLIFSKEYLKKQQQELKKLIKTSKNEEKQKFGFFQKAKLKQDTTSIQNKKNEEDNQSQDIMSRASSFSGRSQKSKNLSKSNNKQQNKQSQFKPQSPISTVKNQSILESQKQRNPKTVIRILETNPDEVQDNATLINKQTMPTQETQIQFVKINLDDKNLNQDNQQQLSQRSGEIELIDEEENLQEENNPNAQKIQQDPFTRRKSENSKLQNSKTPDGNDKKQKNRSKTQFSKAQMNIIENNMVFEKKLEQHYKDYYYPDEEEEQQQYQNEAIQQNMVSKKTIQKYQSNQIFQNQITLTSFEETNLNAKNFLTKKSIKIQQDQVNEMETYEKYETKQTQKIPSQNKINTMLSQNENFQKVNSKKIQKLQQKQLENESVELESSKSSQNQNQSDQIQNPLQTNKRMIKNIFQKQHDDAQEENEEEGEEDEYYEDEEEDEEQIDQSEQLDYVQFELTGQNDNKKDEDAELCEELEYRIDDWIQQIQSYILEFLEEVAIQKGQESINDKISNIQLNYLYYVIKSFRLLVEINQCPLDHKVIKYLTEFFKIESKEQYSYQNDQIPFLVQKTEKQKKKEIFKELDRNTLSIKIKQEIIDIYINVAQRKQKQSFDLLMAQLSSKIEDMVKLDENINFIYGKQKLLMDDFPDYEYLNLEINEDVSNENEDELKSNIESKQKYSDLKRGNSLRTEQSTNQQNKEGLNKNKKISQNQKEEEEKPDKIFQISKKKEDFEKNKQINIQVIKKFDKSILKYYNFMNDYVNKELIKFMANLFTVLQKDLGGKFEIYSTTFISNILEIMKYNKDQNLNERLIYLMFFITNQRQEFLQMLCQAQIIFRNEEIAKFEVLQALTNVMKTFQERRFIFQISSDVAEMQKLLQLMQATLQKGIVQLKEAQKKIEVTKKEEDYFYKIQKMLFSLDYHVFVLEFLEDAYLFFMQKIQIESIQPIIQQAFEFLTYFCLDNLENIQAIKQYYPIIQSYLACTEIGQTPFFAEIFLDVTYKRENIEKGMLQDYLNSLREKSDSICQIDPSNLITFNNLFLKKGIYRENIANQIFKEIFQTENIYKFFGMKNFILRDEDDLEIDEEEQKLDQNQMKILNSIRLNIQQIQSNFFNRLSTIFLTQLNQIEENSQKLSFEMDWIQKDRVNYQFLIINYSIKLNIKQLPYLYQAYALRTARIIYSNLRTKDRFNDQLKLIFSTQYLFSILSGEDFYKEQNEENFLRLILKLELMQTIDSLWLKTQNYPSDIIRNQAVIKFIREQIKILDNYSEEKNSEVENFIQQVRNSQTLSNLHQCYLQTYALNYLKNIMPLNKKTFLEEPYGVLSYIFKYLIPFMTHLNIVFSNLAQSSWYPEVNFIFLLLSSIIIHKQNKGLPKSELTLLGIFGQKFYDFFFKKLNQMQQLLIKENFKEEITEFQKIFEVGSFFTEKGAFLQNLDRQIEKDKDNALHLKNLSLVKNKSIIGQSINKNNPSSLYSHNLLKTEQSISKNELGETKSILQNHSLLKHVEENQNTNELKSMNQINEKQQTQNKNAFESRLQKFEQESQQTNVQLQQNGQPISITSLFNQKRENLLSNLNSQNVSQFNKISDQIKQMYLLSNYIYKQDKEQNWNQSKYLSDEADFCTLSKQFYQAGSSKLSGKNNILIEMEFSSLEIGKHLPYLRNLLSLRRKEQSSQTYRKLFQSILVNQNVRQNIVLNQNDYLIKMILYEVNQKNKDKVNIGYFQKPIDIKVFNERIFAYLDHTLLYLDLTNQQLQTYIIQNIINLVIEIIDREPDESKREMQNFIYFKCFKKIMKNSLMKQTTLSNQEIIQSLIRLICKLLEGKNKEVRNDIYDILSSVSEIENLINCIYKVVYQQMVATKCLLNKKKMIFHLINNYQNYSFRRDQTSLFEHICKLIQLLNMDQFSPFQVLYQWYYLFIYQRKKTNQIFWRKQMNSNNSQDIMVLYIKLLDQLIKSTILNIQTSSNFCCFSFFNLIFFCQEQISYSKYFNDQIILSIQVLQSMIQGRLMENKDQLMQSTFLENMAQLWDAEKYLSEEQILGKRKQDKYLEYFLGIIGFDNRNELTQNALTEQNLNLVKNYMLQMFEHLVESDMNQYRKKQIVRRLTYQNLFKCFIDQFQQFKDQHQGVYSTHSHQFLKYGFKIFSLLHNHEESINNLEQALINQANQLIGDQSIKTLIKTEKDIQHEKEISIFAEAYSFFEKNTGIIIIFNEEINELQVVYFPYTPHCNSSNSIVETDINKKIDRFSYETKIKSFFDLAEEYNQRLFVIQSLKDKAIKNKIFKLLTFIFNYFQIFRQINFLLGISINIYLLLKYQDVEGSAFFSKIRQGTLDDFMKIIIIILFGFDFLMLLFQILQIKSYFSWKVKNDIKNKIIQKKQQNSLNFQSSKGQNLKQIIQQQLQSKTSSSNENINLKLSKSEVIQIYIQNWFSSNTISYVALYTPVLFLTLFFNDFFAAILLFDIFFQFPDALNIFKVVWNMKVKIISTLFLYFILIYIFSLITFLVTPLNDVYNNMCDNFLTCFSIFLDSTLRSMISSSPIYDPIYESKYLKNVSLFQILQQLNIEYNNNYVLTYENIYLFFYTFCVVSLIWTWTFTGNQQYILLNYNFQQNIAYFIDAFTQLRIQNENFNNDIQNICLICTLDRKQITQICPKGFDYHINNVHNQWDYLKYISILLTKNKEEYTSTEAYIFEKWQKRSTNWIPNGQQTINFILQQNKTSE
ncbi:hypothetical protein ABPG72_006985 [Tetrahymena utriculariae]